MPTIKESGTLVHSGSFTLIQWHKINEKMLRASDSFALPDYRKIMASMH